MRVLFLLFALLATAPLSAQTITGKYLFTPKPEGGAWYDPAQSGTGWFFDFQGPIAFGASFGYELDGQSRFWTMSGVMSLPPDPTGPTNQPADAPIATLSSAVFSFANGQCHGCPYRAPVPSQAHPEASLRWLGPRRLEFTAGGNTVSMSPFETSPFDLSGDWQGTFNFRSTSAFTSRPVFRLTKRTDVRAYHVDPSYTPGWEVTTPTPGAQEYNVQCIQLCTNVFAPILPDANITWWVDPVTGKGGIIYVQSVNPLLFPTPFQIFVGNSSYGRWSPQLWVTRNRIVGRSYVPALQAQTIDVVVEIELIRMVPGQSAGLRP